MITAGRAAAGALLLVAVLSAGCASWLPPPMTAALRAASADGPARAELTSAPFWPLTEAAQARHCGPQALATTLTAAGLRPDIASLTEAVYLPARGGSLQIEMPPAAARAGALAVRVPGTLQTLIDEIDAGHPVLVLQNLGLGWAPRWHYAVVVGYDRAAQVFVLRSGNEARQLLPWETFELTWARGGHWAMLTLPPGDLPVSSDATQEALALEAALGFERVAMARPGALAEVVAVWRSLRLRWPDSLPAAVGLGGALVQAGHLDRAADAMEAAARQFRSAVLWNNLAQVEIDRRRWDAAESAVAEALRLARQSEPRWLAEVEETAAALASARAR